MRPDLLDCIVLFEGCEHVSITDYSGGSSAVCGVTNPSDQRTAKHLRFRQYFCGLEHDPSKTFTVGRIRLDLRDRLRTGTFVL